MNEQDMEALLRQTPRVRVPADLRERLEADISLPHATQAESGENVHATLVLGRPTIARGARPIAGWLRRWMPALGFALWILGCVVVLGVQGTVIRQLKAEETRRRAEALVANPAPVPPSTTGVSAAELDRLRKDAVDVQRLREETARLRELLAQAPVLRAANEKLREELKAQVAPAPRPEDDLFGFMERQKEKAQRIQCVNHLKQVVLAARIWANDHPQTDGKEVMPASFEAMRNELSTEKITFCPFEGGGRYELLSPGAPTEEPGVVFIRCANHNNVGMVDGSVQQLGGRFRLVQRNGRWQVEMVQEIDAP